MKRRIFFSFLALFLCSSFGALYSYVNVNNTSGILDRLIKLHQIETFRQQLLNSIQTVQSELYRSGFKHDNKTDSIIKGIETLEQSASKCSSCHHSPELSVQIAEIQSLTDLYKNSLIFLKDSSVLKEGEINKRILESADIGNRLSIKSQNLCMQAGASLKAVTSEASRMVEDIRTTLIITMAMTLILGIVAAVYLTRAFIRPVDLLLEATRAIASGKLGYSVEYRDNTEFGELASNFNMMSKTLQSSYAKLEEEIKEHRRTEKALEKSESFLNTIFDSIRDPFCIIDSEYKITWANEAYAAMKGLPLSSLLGKVCHEVLHGRQNICDDCVVEKTFATGDSCTKEKCLISPDGTSRWSVIFTYPIMDSTGKLSHVIEYSQDITERKWSEEALRESEERYALAAQGSNDGLWDWDLRKNAIYLSSRSKSMLGLSEDEIGNKPEEWLSRIHPDDRPEMEARIAAHINGRIPHFEHEFRIRHKDDSWRWMLARGLAVRDESGVAYRMAGSQTDITSNKLATEQLVYNAFHDALTDLPNRSLFMDRLQHVITTSTRRGMPYYAVLFLDLDRFKVINDSLGHLVGDKLLLAVGQKITECIRLGDTVARLGGDEYSILLEDIKDINDAVDIADRIHQFLSIPFTIEEHQVYSTVSIGIALGLEKYERAEQVLRDADIAMYEAKKRGNGSSEIFDIGMHASILDRIRLESELHGALDNNELTLVYQPIVDLSSHRLVGFEALVRWNHPERGVVLPAEFIPVAEETGMIVKIGEWILREACRELGELQSRFPSDPPLKMSVNISGKQFAKENLADLVSTALQNACVAPKSLAIEITESMLMENIDVAVATMNRLRAMGVHIHIDDFGTGYSSLSYLHSLPIDALKIDRSFIKKLTDKGENQEIIQSIMMLAKSLNFEVIAEGVELDHQLEQMKGLKCGFGQGYLFSKPMSPEAIDSWVQAKELKIGEKEPDG